MLRFKFYLFIVFCLAYIAAEANNFTLPSFLLPGTYAIYWGCFDPPTLAHRDIIVETINGKEADAVIVVINNFNNQTYAADITDRIKMLEILLSDYKEKIIYFIQDENHKADYNYIKSQINGKLIAVVGQDSFEKWEKYTNDFSSYDEITVVPRFVPASINPMATNLPDNISIMKIKDDFYNCSSTQARNELLNNQQASSFISISTFNYINDRGLYKRANFVK